MPSDHENDDSMPETKGTQANDAADADYTPSSHSKKTTKNKEVAKNKEDAKKKKNVKKVESEWNDKLTFKLISAVEGRPVLWNVGASEYKLPKTSAWEEVSQMVGMEIDECKAKFANLRISFKTNVAKMRATKSGQGAADVNQIHWRFFKSMMFIEANDAKQSTASKSNYFLVIDLIDNKIYIALMVRCTFIIDTNIIIIIVMFAGR